VRHNEDLLNMQLASSLPWAVDPAQVLITTGSQQGLDLVAKVLIDAGSRVLVESPTYLGAVSAFTPMEPDVHDVANDGEGIDLTDLRVKAGAGTGSESAARFLYVLPNFQNPTGRSMSEAGRAGLSQTAAGLGLPLVEDNPYGDLWFDTPAPAPLTAWPSVPCRRVKPAAAARSRSESASGVRTTRVTKPGPGSGGSPRTVSASAKASRSARMRRAMAASPSGPWCTA
jgi:DNA-binding transcriptional MocR family regulator